MFFLAAEAENGRAVGYVGLMYVLDEGYISNVAVSQDRRREGIADMLLDELRARAEAKKLSFLTLEVRLGNVPAQSLYKNTATSRSAGERDTTACRRRTPF